MTAAFVIPMAGASRRFKEAGIQEPKYRLQAHGRSLFAHALSSFSAYFDSYSFLFIFRDQDGVADFVQTECRSLGIAKPRFAALGAPTSGQAETVLLGLEQMKARGPITIFNIDTARPAFRFADVSQSPHCDGYLEVFEGSGSNWSFVRPDPTRHGHVAETSEKRPISNLCCTGLYHFRSADLFRQAYANPAPPKGDAEARERYVAPLYNRLIGDGRDIRYHLIAPADVTFFGTPAEYADFCGR